MPEPLPLRVVFLTGQSDPRSCDLSPVQRAFLDGLPVEERARGRLNFPYREGLAPHRPTPLVTASWHNARATVSSALPGFAAQHRASVATELALAERTLVLAGSCGLQLLQGVHLPPAVLARLHVLAYGPVTWGSSTVAAETVLGRRDRVSRVSHSTADHVVDCGHLDYLTCPQFATIAAAAARRLTQEVSR